MDATILVICTALMCIMCFLVGASVGQKVNKDEEIELPKVNPLKAYREREAKREAQAEQDRLDTIMRNIENYDGTEHGQVDVPRG